MSVNNHQSTPPNIPEKRRTLPHRVTTLESLVSPRLTHFQMDIDRKSTFGLDAGHVTPICSIDFLFGT
jgi:hypothetical protein